MHRVSKAAKVSLLASTSMTVMAGAIIAPALPGIGRAFEHAPNAKTLAPLVLTVTSLAIALSSVPAGLLADKLGRKPVLLCSLLLYALAGTVGLYTADLYQLLASRFLLGIAVAGVMTSANTLIADLFEGPRRISFLGFQSASMALGAVTFLITGGFLAQSSWRYPFALYALSLLVFACVATFIKEPRHTPSSEDKAKQSPPSKTPLLRIAFLYGTTFSWMLLFYLIAAQLPFLLRQRFDAAPPLIGAVIATSNFFGAVSGFNYRHVRKRLSSQQSFALSFAIIAIGFTIVAHAPNLPIFFLSMALCGLGTGLAGPNANSTLADLIPSGSRGRYFGGLTTSIFVGQFISPLSIQHIAVTNGYQGFNGAFSVASLFALVIASLYLISHYRIPQPNAIHD